MRERCETCALSEVCDGNCTGYEECADVREAQAEHGERKADGRREGRGVIFRHLTKLRKICYNTRVTLGWVKRVRNPEGVGQRKGQ